MTRVSGSLSAYVCQCVTECECVSGKPCVSVSPSVSEAPWNEGEERARERGKPACLPLQALPPESLCDLEGHFPPLGLSFLKCNMRCGASWTEGPRV